MNRPAGSPPPARPRRNPRPALEAAARPYAAPPVPCCPGAGARGRQKVRHRAGAPGTENRAVDPARAVTVTACSARRGLTERGPGLAPRRGASRASGGFGSERSQNGCGGATRGGLGGCGALERPLPTLPGAAGRRFRGASAASHSAACARGGRYAPEAARTPFRSLPGLRWPGWAGARAGCGRRLQTGHTERANSQAWKQTLGNKALLQRELQADGRQQGLETLLLKQGPPTRLRDGRAREQEAGGPIPAKRGHESGNPGMLKRFQSQ